MYQDAIFRWNIMVGCKWNCSYCVPSYQRQMKRQKPTIDKNGRKRGCQKCYDYEPHFHPERLYQSLPKTRGDEFIWCCSSGDISFAEEGWMEKILERVRELSNRTFFFQTKNPKCFYEYDFPDNVILGITLESNLYYPSISRAPSPFTRYIDFLGLPFERKIITIEPILKFSMDIMIKWIKQINPERIYIGYNTKNCSLPEPSLRETTYLIRGLEQLEVRVKTKLLRERWK